MLALRQTSSISRRALLTGVSIRGQATVVSTPAASSASAPPPPPGAADETSDAATPTRGRRHKKTPPKRPSISLASPRKWHRPLAPGVVPAYDLALRVLKEDSGRLKEEVGGWEGRVKEVEGKVRALEGKEGKEGELQALKDELEKLVVKKGIIEVQSEVNLPDVRWIVNNAMADMSKPSHRHLVEQKWRKDGDLDLLMERLYQMHVIPDVLPTFEPSIDLHVVARATPSEYLKSEQKRVQTQVEPGTFIRPRQTLVPPKLRVNVFHTDERLYTMLLIDPDVPNPENESYTTYLHWMKPNISLSATSSPNLINLNTHTKYIPPHPQRGSPYHRYVCLLLLQPPVGGDPWMYSRGHAHMLANADANDTADPTKKCTSTHLDIPVVRDEERLGFDVREFVNGWWGLSGDTESVPAVIGGGAHMWREVWDEDVSKIYKDVLGKEEPQFSRPPKVNIYNELKGQKKYIL